MSAEDIDLALVNDALTERVLCETTSVQTEWTGRVTSKDLEGVYYVDITGGATAMPCVRSLVDVRIGQIVDVRIQNGHAVITGCRSDPVATSSSVNVVEKKVTTVRNEVQIIRTEKADVTELNAVRANVEELHAQYGEFETVVTQDLLAANADITNLKAKDAEITGQLTAANADITNLKAKDVTIEGNLSAATGRIDTLESDNVTVKGRLDVAEADIDDLEADHVSTDDLDATNARIGTVEADYLKAADMTAEQARVNNLLADKATVNDLNAATGRITVLESTKANISDLEANYITADDIEATYMHANMSNSDVAWIQNGVIADGAITNAMIGNLSANKITTGTLNAANLTVTGLKAQDIEVERINGQTVTDKTLVDALTQHESDISDRVTQSDFDAEVERLQGEIDGAIETWTGTEVPTLSNSPASSWTTSEARDTHVGDVYFVVNSQSQQNGYNYRFTKSGSTYSWQLIKDSDVTNALQRLTTAEGKITTFDSDISTLKTDTGEIKTRTTSLETRMSDAEDDILDKVDTTTFNEVSDTVDSHSRSISQMSETLSNKADGSTVTALTNRVSTTEQNISGINTTIGELQTTVASKADGSEVTTISNKLNTVSDTVDGHTQTISSVQSTLSTKADNSTVSTLTERVSTTESNVSGITTRLTATESVANGVRADFDNLEIGGRNLLKGSMTHSTEAGMCGWYTNGYGEPELVEKDGKTCLHLQASPSGNYIPSIRTRNRVNLEWGMEYRASAWLMLDKEWKIATNSVPFHYHTGSVANLDEFDLSINNHGGGVDTSMLEPAIGTVIPANTWVKLVTKIVTNKTAPSADYPYPVWAPFIYGQCRTISEKTSVNLWMRDYMFEVGNLPTPWTPAPEDMESEVTSLKTDYATYKQTTTEALSEIGTTYATKTELGTETSNRQTAIQQVNDAISLKANSSDVYTKQQSDGLISTEVTNRNAAITAKADEITSSVSETYATKDAVSGIDTRLTTAESSITQQAGQIALKANAADVNTKAETTALLEVKANKATLTSEINASADTVKIDATRVNIEGAAIFTSGRLSQSSLNDAYDAAGSASAAQAAAISAAATDATSKANAAQTAATNAANSATDTKLQSYSTTSQMNAAIQDATGPLFYGRENSSGYIHLGHVPCAVDSTGNYSHLHLTGRIGGWLSATSGSIDVTFKSRNSNSGYNTVDRKDETISTSFVDVLVYTGTDGFTHYWLKVNSYWYAQLYAEFELFVEDDHTRTDTEPDGTCVWKLSEQTAVAATKANAVKRTQRIWYRKSASGVPSTPGTASSNWVDKADDGDNAWTKMHVAISSSAKYIYTCEQYEMGDGTVGYTSVLLDNTITVIDGGNIITGSVTANQLSANSVTADKIAANAVTADKIAANAITVGKMPSADQASILNSNVQVGGRNLFQRNSMVVGYLGSTGVIQVNEDNGERTSEFIAIAPNTSYALQYWTDSSLTSWLCLQWYDSAKSFLSEAYRNHMTTDYYSGAFTSPGNAAYARISARWLADGTAKVKLEKGNKPTDWTPAPEDVDATIDGVVLDVQNKADSASLDSTNDDLTQLVAGLSASDHFNVNDDGSYTFGLDDALGSVEAKAAQDLSDSETILNNKIDANVTALESRIDEASQANLYIHLADDGVEIGKNIDGTAGAFRQLMDDQGTHWQYNREDAAYVGVNDEGKGTMFLDEAQVTGRLRVGNYIFVGNDAGTRMSLKWIGD